MSLFLEVFFDASAGMEELNQHQRKHTNSTITRYKSKDSAAMNEFTSKDPTVQRHNVDTAASSNHNESSKVRSIEELSCDIRLMAKQIHFTPTKEDENIEVVKAAKDVNHQYRDFACGEERNAFPFTCDDIRLQKLPTKLNAMLSDPEINHIISWMPHGRAWKIWKKKEFIKDVLPKYFEYCNYNSFVRLVNAWGFCRITSGLDANAYYHELFLRGMPHLHGKMHRLKKKQKKASATLRADPDFYAMDKVSPLPSADHSSEEDKLKPRGSLEVSQKNELTILSKQVPQLSPFLSARTSGQLGNTHLANYLVGQQHQEQLAASPLYRGLNQNALIVNQLFAQQQRQISLSTPINVLSSILANNNVAALPASNNVGAAVYGNNNNAAALNILKSIQQQRLLGVAPLANAPGLSNGFQR